MTVWEETWTLDKDPKWPAVSFRGGAGASTVVFGELNGWPGEYGTLDVDPADVARARLASAAPDLARALLAVEWCGLKCVDWETYLECCPCCQGAPPGSVDPKSRYAVEIHDGHEPDCALDAALRKAGIR